MQYALLRTSEGSLGKMGCSSAKELPASKPISYASLAENTLLVAGSHSREAAKEAIVDPIDVAKPPQLGFEGAWSGGVISGPFLTYADGSVSQVRVTRVVEGWRKCSTSGEGEAGNPTTRVVEVSRDGASFTGKLQDDDRIHWDDGRIWTRYHVCAAFCEHEGFIDASGPDLLVQTMTPEEAKCKAAAMPNCRGFTYEGEPTDMPVKMYFKGQWSISSSGCRHTSCKKEAVSCAVGDSVLATFTPNGRRYAAEIESISADNTITVKWADGGKTHRTLCPLKVFKDYAATFKAASLPSDTEPCAELEHIDPLVLVSSSHSEPIDPLAPGEVLESVVWAGLHTISEEERSLRCESAGEDVMPKLIKAGPEKELAPSSHPHLRDLSRNGREISEPPQLKSPARREKGLCCC